ncbi:hypothetical protein evm_014076 [Chilo suppressalis]|nr:hypothetical protein evm_014076 [Chilo suppressalis]
MHKRLCNPEARTAGTIGRYRLLLPPGQATAQEEGGTSGFERLMDRLMELSEYMVRRIREQPDRFYLILEPELVNVSFWYLPRQLRGVPHDKHKEIKLGKVCAKLKGKMMQAGTIMVGYQPDDRRPNFFRNIISSAAVTEKDVDFLLAEMDRLGQDIVVD